jgi:hypothetical protein
LAQNVEREDTSHQQQSIVATQTRIMAYVHRTDRHFSQQLSSSSETTTPLFLFYNTKALEQKQLAPFEKVSA